jgi:hypothetical protein
VLFGRLIVMMSGDEVTKHVSSTYVMYEIVFVPGSEDHAFQTNETIMQYVYKAFLLDETASS